MSNPNFAIGLGSSATAEGNITIGQAPATLWADARSITKNQTDRLSWNFGDVADVRNDPRHSVNPTLFPNATVDLNTSLTGQVVAHVYDTPGTYTVTLNVTHADGTATVYVRTFIVAVDTRKHYWFDSINGNDANAGTQAAPFKTGAKFISIAGQSNTYVHLNAGTSLNIVSSLGIYLRSNCVIEGIADSSGNLPTLNIKGIGFAGWDGVTNGAIIRRVNATSAYTSSVVSGVTVKVGTGEFLFMRGHNVAVLDCTLDVLDKGIEGNDAAALGLLIQGCRQTEQFGIASQVFSAWGCGMVVWVANTTLGSINESPCRTDNFGGGAGFTMEYNSISQLPQNAKATLTNRNASNGVVHGNLFNGQDVGASCTLGTTTTWIKQQLYLNNAIINGHFDIAARVSGMTIEGNYIQQTGYAGINITVASVDTITIKGNSGNANSVRIYGGSSVAGLVSDVKVIV